MPGSFRSSPRTFGLSLPLQTELSNPLPSCRHCFKLDLVTFSRELIPKKNFGFRSFE